MAYGKNGNRLGYKNKDPEITFFQDFTLGSLANASRIGATMTYSGASSGTFFNSSGALTVSTSDQVRLDHDPVTLVPLGVLIEGQRANQITTARIRNLTNAGWVKTNTTAALDQIGLTKVANSASSLTATANNGTALLSITDAVSEQRTYSVWVKRLVGSGTIEITANNLTATKDITASINSSSFTKTQITATGTNPVLGFRMGTSGDKIAVDANQLEDAGFASSPILSNVTRTADFLRITGTNVSNVIIGTKGSIVIKARRDQIQTGTNAHIFRIRSDAQTGNDPQLALFGDDGNAEITFNYLPLAGNTCVVDLPTEVAGTFHQTSISYASNDCAGSLDRGTVVKDTTVLVETGFDEFVVGSSNNTAHYFGWIKKVQFFDKRMSDTFLQTHGIE